MSSDRTCRMSDLRAAENRLGSKISAAESKARKATSNVSAMRSDMNKVKRKVSNLASDVSDLTSNVSQLSGDVSKQRQQIYQLDGEIVELEAQQDADRRLIQHNQQLINSIEQDIAVLDQDVAANRQMIGQVRQHAQILQQEMDLAQQRIEENNKHIQQLEMGVQQINNYLEAERQAREAEQRTQMADVEAQKQLAATLRSSLEVERVQRFGNASAYETALTTLAHAEDSTRLGQFQAARTTYQDAQRQFSEIVRNVDKREQEYHRVRGRCEATLKQLGLALQEAGTEEMLIWHTTDYQALQARYEDLQRLFQNGEFEQADRPEQVVTALEQMTASIKETQQAVAVLEQQLMETLQQAQTRIDMMEKMMTTLMDIWSDNKFDIQYSYAQHDDPKTTLKVQTVRPKRANVTLNMELDGTVHFSWTGYMGMECAHNIEQFEQTLRSQHQLDMAISGVEDKPGQRNPDFGPGGRGPEVMNMDQKEYTATKAAGR